MADENTIYGIMAEFDEPEELLAATRQTYEQGYRKIEAYSPFPVEGLDEAVGMRRNWVPIIILIFGIMGGAGAFFMMWFATVVSYPLNVGGRPLDSWPAYIPITFELTILSAATAALFAVILLNGLPMPYHPVWNVPDFIRASRDRFFLTIEAEDPKFDLANTRSFLQSLPGVRDVAEIQP